MSDNPFVQQGHFDTKWLSDYELKVLRVNGVVPAGGLYMRLLTALCAERRRFHAQAKRYRWLEAALRTIALLRPTQRVGTAIQIAKHELAVQGRPVA